MAIQERLNKQGQKYIAGLANTIKVLWEKACEFDSVPVESKFVVFSDGNKFAKFYGIAMNQYFEARQQYVDGGYVGLSVRDRQVR